MDDKTFSTSYPGNEPGFYLQTTFFSYRLDSTLSKKSDNSPTEVVRALDHNRYDGLMSRQDGLNDQRVKQLCSLILKFYPEYSPYSELFHSELTILEQLVGRGTFDYLPELIRSVPGKTCYWMEYDPEQKKDRKAYLNHAPFLVINYIAGETLFQHAMRWDQSKRLVNTQGLLPAFRALCHELDKAEIVHRDISPNNLIITPEDKLHLIDFAYALDLRIPTHQRAPLGDGTAYYASPEVELHKKNIDPRSDQFSFACLLYFLLTNRKPIINFGVDAQEIQSVYDALKDGYSQVLASAVTKALSEDPEQRYANYDAFYQGIEQAIEQHLQEQSGAYQLREQKAGWFSAQTEFQKQISELTLLASDVVQQMTVLAHFKDGTPLLPDDLQSYLQQVKIVDGFHRYLKQLAQQEAAIQQHLEQVNQALDSSDYTALQNRDEVKPPKLNRTKLREQTQCIQHVSEQLPALMMQIKQSLATRLANSEQQGVASVTQWLNKVEVKHQALQALVQAWQSKKANSEQLVLKARLQGHLSTITTQLSRIKVTTCPQGELVQLQLELQSQLDDGLSEPAQAEAYLKRIADYEKQLCEALTQHTTRAEELQGLHDSVEIETDYWQSQWKEKRGKHIGKLVWLVMGIATVIAGSYLLSATKAEIIVQAPYGLYRGEKGLVIVSSQGELANALTLKLDGVACERFARDTLAQRFYCASQNSGMRTAQVSERDQLLKQGELYVSALRWPVHWELEPEDVSLKLDGRSISPEKDIEEGSYKLEISRAGFISQSHQIQIKEGSSFNFTLSPQLFDVQLSVTPSDAQIELDGQPYVAGQYPYGKHTITLSKTNYQPQIAPIFLEQDVTQTYTLKQSHFVLDIQATPSDAQVYLNGKAYNGEPLKQGRYQFEVKKEGYMTQQIDIALPQQDVARPELQPAHYALDLNVFPKDSQVLLNGQPYEVGRQYPYGDYEVTVRREYYQPQSYQFKLNQDTKQSFELQQSHFVLNIDVTPADADISVNGKAYNPGKAYPKGEYKISLSKPGYFSESQILSVNADSQISVVLSKQLGGSVELSSMWNEEAEDALQQATASLTVLTEPVLATVKIMNINPKYRPEMKLKPGMYHIQVSASGYETKSEWVKLGSEDLQHAITLSAIDSGFIAHVNGTATQGHLMWMRCAVGQTWTGSNCIGEAKGYSWDDAVSMAESFSFAGYSDWRLPSVEELEQIVYCNNGRRSINRVGVVIADDIDANGECLGSSYLRPTINRYVFPNADKTESVNAYTYWSASDPAYYDNCAWQVSFYNGSTTWYLKIKNFYSVRLVRTR